jgi:serine/threonine-protein kinase
MDLVGKKLGQYEIQAEIGRGGMATVYRGYQASLNRSVAVKVLAGELARDPGFRERFAREAHAVAQLRASAHPRLVRLFGEDPEPA